MKNMYSLALTLTALFYCFYGVTQSYNMNQLGVWTDTNLVPNANGYTFNECFGFEINGKEYGVIGSTHGTHIIDITNPANLIEIDFVPGKFQGNVTHRDYDVHNGYLYMVCDQATSSLQIADLSFLPDSVHVVYDKDEIIVRSHNVFIDTAHDILYSCGGSKTTGNNELSLLDISNPAVPTLIADLADDVSWWSSFVGYVHDIYVRDNIAYTNDADAMHVIDFSNPTSPIVLGSISSYTDKGYNHSGYLSADDSTYVMCDETHGKRTKFMDVSNPSNLLVTDVQGPALPNSTSIPHNPIIKGDYVYVSYYYDGVQVYNIKDKYNVKNVAYFDTYQGLNAGGGEGCWGVYPLLKSGKILASDRRKGLFVLEHLTPPVISFSESSRTKYEYEGKQFIKVQLSNSLDDTVKVTVNIDPASTASLNLDYSIVSQFPKQLIFEPGTTKDSVEVILLNDVLNEPIETLIFSLSSPIRGKLGTPISDTLFILSDEFSGINEEKNSSRNRFFPNPATSGEVVSFSKLVNYKIIDVSGKIIVENRSYFLNTKDLNSGTYFIQYNGKTEKLIIH